MNKSESIENLAKALVKVQSEIRGYKEDSNNPFFNSTYGDLTSVWQAIRKPLTDNGLSVVQTLDKCDPMPPLPERKNKKGEILPPAGDAIAVETILLHTSGEWVSSRLEVRPDIPGPQAVGSAITYARRFSLAAICGISPEDDDAEGASNRNPKPQANQPRQQNQKPAAQQNRKPPAQESKKRSVVAELYDTAKNVEKIPPADFSAALKTIGITKDEKSFSGENKDRVAELSRWITDYNGPKNKPAPEQQTAPREGEVQYLYERCERHLDVKCVEDFLATLCTLLRFEGVKSEDDLTQNMVDEAHKAIDIRLKSKHTADTANRAGL